MAIAFLFGAGEEVSWGQRILGLETPQWFREYNAQREINLQNLTVNGLNLNKLIFSNGLGLVFVIYLLILAPLYRRKTVVRNLLNTIAVPIPQNYQFWGYGLVLLLIPLIDSSRKWELLEFALVFLVWLTLTFPYNKDLFRRNLSQVN